MKCNFPSASRVIGSLSVLSLFAINIAAQLRKEDTTASDGTSWTTILFLAASGFGIAYYFWRKSKGASKLSYANSYKKTQAQKSHKYGGLDLEKNIESLHKTTKRRSVSPTNGSKLASVLKRDLPEKPPNEAAEPFNPETKIFQEKMKKLQYAQLPLNSFTELTRSKSFEPLPLSNDPSLINAIEQAYDEEEEDESIRDLAVRILMAFRTRNSAEALSQTAIYDLSSALRAKAVTILTDFDHPSVFEAILLACADPTREVRAAAARGLFRLNFDRADAWTRIIETGDEFRMSHAARAATEAGIVIKAFERLIHEDRKVAYEAFVLVNLLIRSGETDAVFDAIKTHKDERVRIALLHVIRCAQDQRTLAELNEMMAHCNLSTDVTERLVDTITSFETVHA